MVTKIIYTLTDASPQARNINEHASASIFLFIYNFLAATSFANNPGISYQGRIFKPDGAPLEGSSVQFRLQVRSPGSENCLRYEEVQTFTSQVASY